MGKPPKEWRFKWGFCGKKTTTYADLLGISWNISNNMVYLGEFSLFQLVSVWNMINISIPFLVDFPRLCLRWWYILSLEVNGGHDLMIMIYGKWWNMTMTTSFFPRKRSTFMVDVYNTSCGFSGWLCESYQWIRGWPFQHRLGWRPSPDRFCPNWLKMFKSKGDLNLNWVHPQILNLNT